MAEQQTLARDIELPYPMMTDAGFPWGLRCTPCRTLITDGQPYASRPVGVLSNGDPLCRLTCVYCPAPD